MTMVMTSVDKVKQSRLAQLRDWWDTLTNLDLSKLNELGHELCDLGPACGVLGLNRLTDVPCPELPAHVLPDEKPSFKCLTLEVLASLRGALHEKEKPDGPLAWGETLMRFCELRLHTIEERARAKWPEEDDARLGLQNLTAFLLECYGVSSDLRYLNTVLKLQDQDVVLAPKKTPAGLTGSGKTLHSALISVRLVVLTESALQEMEVSP
jgi:hypothetical protein